MNQVVSQHIDCPYCGETISILVDHSVEGQQYIEDCEVCCRPIVFDVLVDANDQVRLQARAENE